MVSVQNMSYDVMGLIYLEILQSFKHADNWIKLPKWVL